MGAHDSEELEDGELPETDDKHAYGMTDGPYIDFDALEPEGSSDGRRPKADSKRAAKRRKAIEALERLQQQQLLSQQPHQEQQHQHTGHGKRKASSSASPPFKQGHQHGTAGSHGSAVHNAVYHNAQPSIEIKQGAGPIKLEAVRDLALYALLGASAVQAPTWAFLKNQPLVKHVVLVMLPGLSLDTFHQHKEQLPSLAALGDPAVVTSSKDLTTSLDAARQLLMTVDNSGKGKRRREAQGQYSSHLDGKRSKPATAPAAAQLSVPTLQPGAHHVNGQHAGTSHSHGSAHGKPRHTLSASTDVPPPPPCSPPPTSSHSSPMQHIIGQSGAPGPPSNQHITQHYDGNLQHKQQHQPGQDAAHVSPHPVQAPGKPHKAEHPEDGTDVRQGRQGDVEWAQKAPYPPSHYVATIKQLQDNNYPLPEVDEASGAMRCPPNWTATQPRPNSQADGGCTDSSRWAGEHVVALDCEMCLTAEGFELTRVTLVDAPGQVIADELVVPYNPITDYLERYSGINAAMLANVTTRLEDAQKLLLRHVHADTLLVGHALENDLRALKLLHSKILDTAILYPHPAGPPAKCALRVLSAKYLGQTIQQGAHDSAIDARTALDLVRLKIINGPSWGVEQGPPGAANKKITELLFERQHKCAVVGSLHSLSRFAAVTSSLVGCTHDHEVAKKAAQLSRSHSFVTCQLTGLDSWLLARSQYRAEIDTAWVLQPPTDPTGDVQTCSNASKQVSWHRSRHGSMDGGEARSRHTWRRSESVDRDSQSSDQKQEAKPTVPVDALLLGRHQGNQSKSGQPRLAAVLQELDKCVGSIWAALQPSTLLVVAGGNGDVHEWKRVMEQMFKRRRHMEEPLYVGWNQAAETAYHDLAERQRKTPVWAAVRQQ